jgi:competence ComEA-like helix-hairpin-helix protein
MERKTFKDYLRFSRKERLGLFTVVIIVVLIFAYPLLFNSKADEPLVIIKSADRENADQKENNDHEQHDEYNNDQFHSYSNSTYETRPSFRETPRGKLFYFDPNTASVEEWQKLGLRDRTIRTIKNYLSKGGSFRHREDLMKIYGLHEDEYARLEPYIRITSKQITGTYSNQYAAGPYPRPVFTSSFNRPRDLTIDDINTADAEAFIALPGIGNSYANRIINFRDKLGGFYSVDQVSETYGLPDSTFQLIRPMLKLNSSVRKIRINTATKDELKTHPYIRWNLANAIVEYRNQHGPYKSIEELKRIVLIDDATFSRVAPYLSLD